jgi:hypothetical protein
MFGFEMGWPIDELKFGIFDGILNEYFKFNFKDLKN